MSEEEMATVVSILDSEGKKLTKVQKDMISSDNQYACCDAFLRPIFKEAIADRAKIVRQDEQHIIDGINDILTVTTMEAFA